MSTVARRPIRWPRFALVVAGALMLLGAPAQADPRTRARASLDAGMRAFKAKRYARALKAFRKAEVHGAMIGELDRIRWNIARSLEELGRFPEMLNALDRCLEVATTPAKRSRVQNRIRELEERLFARIKVRCATKGTRIALDDGAAQPCPAVLSRVPAGTHRVKATLDDRPFRPQTVQLKAGQRAEVRIEAAGALEIAGPAGARITLGGRAIGKAPLRLKRLPPGYYPVGVGAETRRVAVRPGASTRVSADAPLGVSHAAAPAETGGGWTEWRPWVAGGASAALLVTATLYGLSAKDEWDAAHDLAAQQRAADLDDKPGLRRRAVEAGDASRRDQIIAGASLAGALAAGGLAWWWWETRPSVTAGPGWLGLSGTF